MTAPKDTKFETLRTIGQELFNLEQKLHGIVHPKITEKIQYLHSLAYSSISEELEQEEKDWDINFNALSKIQEDNNFVSVWSVSEIDYKKLETNAPKMTEIIYESWGGKQTWKFDKPTAPTWFELWKIAEQLIKSSGDTHHIFIESFNPIKGQKGKFQMWTGS